MDILFQDRRIVVAVKPSGVLSTDEPGGLPELVREALGDPKADVRTVHRLDRVVSGVMVLARNAESASELSRQIREGVFEKEYLAVENKAFLEKVNNHSVTKLVASLYDSHSITEEDLDELAAFIRSKTGGA